MNKINNEVNLDQVNFQSYYVESVNNADKPSTSKNSQLKTVIYIRKKFY